jgi:hypothetical protein
MDQMRFFFLDGYSNMFCGLVQPAHLAGFPPYWTVDPAISVG